MKVIKTIWGNSIDHSLSGLILAENDEGKQYWYLGSRKEWTTKEGDTDYILKWGRKISVKELCDNGAN